MAIDVTHADNQGSSDHGDASAVNSATLKVAAGKTIVTKTGTEVSRTDHQDGTYTIHMKFKDGDTHDETFVNPTGHNHTPQHPDPSYIVKVKTAMSADLKGDQIGEDSNNDGFYKGKSLELGKGGRALKLSDKITWELVQKGSSHEDAAQLAAKKCAEHGVKTYGQKQCDDWAAKSDDQSATMGKEAPTKAPVAMTAK